MMRSTIQRKLIKTTICGFKTSIVDGEPAAVKVEPVFVYGHVTHKEALKELQRVYPDDNVIVAEIAEEVNTYQISIEKFIENAQIIK